MRAVGAVTTGWASRGIMRVSSCARTVRPLTLCMVGMDCSSLVEGTCYPTLTCRTHQANVASSRGWPKISRRRWYNHVAAERLLASKGVTNLVVLVLARSCPTWGLRYGKGDDKWSHLSEQRPNTVWLDAFCSVPVDTCDLQVKATVDGVDADRSYSQIDDSPRFGKLVDMEHLAVSINSLGSDARIRDQRNLQICRDLCVMITQPGFAVFVVTSQNSREEDGVTAPLFHSPCFRA